MRRSLKTLWMMAAMIMLLTALVPTTFGARKATTLRVVLANHPWTDTVKPLIPQFEKETGIRVNVENYEENQLTQKLTVELTSGSSSADVFMTRPLQEGKLFFKNNWYYPLNSYINHKNSAEWNWKDYPASSVKAVTINNRIFAVPLAAEWQVVFYRKDLFEKAKIAPPTSLEELEAAAKALHNPSDAMYGIVSRGQRAAAVTQFSSYLYAFGGDFIKNGKCVLDSPEAIKAFKYYGKLLHDYGPPGVINMHWPQALALFASGKAAMWTDASTFMASLGPGKSPHADKIGVAVFPAGPAGSHPFMIIPWAIGISNQSRNKADSWTFIKWASGLEVTKKAQLAGNTMARSSVWNDAEVLPKIHPDLNNSFKMTGPIGTPYDRPLMTSVVEARDAIGDIIVRSITTGGTGDIEAAAKAATVKVNDLLTKAGEFGK